MEVKYLCKRLRTAITPERDLWDTITIVIILDSLHKDFNATTTSLLEIGNKTINEIQSIFNQRKPGISTNKPLKPPETW